MHLCFRAMLKCSVPGRGRAPAAPGSAANSFFCVTRRASGPAWWRYRRDGGKAGSRDTIHVCRVPDRNVTPCTNVAKTMFVDLGRLRAFKVSQSYAVPPGVNIGDYRSVVIWGEHFGVLISPATLKLL